jgi:hypothetical protein
MSGNKSNPKLVKRKKWQKSDQQIKEERLLKKGTKDHETELVFGKDKNNQ